MEKLYNRKQKMTDFWEQQNTPTEVIIKKQEDKLDELLKKVVSLTDGLVEQNKRVDSANEDIKQFRRTKKIFYMVTVGYIIFLFVLMGLHYYKTTY